MEYESKPSGRGEYYDFSHYDIDGYDVSERQTDGEMKQLVTEIIRAHEGEMFAGDLLDLVGTEKMVLALQTLYGMAATYEVVMFDSAESGRITVMLPPSML